MASNPTAGTLDDQRFSALLNGSYHADREAFLDGTHRSLMMVVILLGTSALLDVAGASSRDWLAAATTLAGTIDLVFDLTTRARKHGYLRRQYFEVAAAMAERRMTSVEADAAMLRSAADEEPIFYAAHALAENWASLAVFGGQRPTPCEVGFGARMMRHLWRFNGRSFACPTLELLRN